MEDEFVGVGGTGGVPALTPWMSDVNVLFGSGAAKVNSDRCLREDLVRIDGATTLEDYGSWNLWARAGQEV